MLGSRLRVFAKPGDFALSNGLVTAVVQRGDGLLTEFWKNALTLPSSDQLGLTTDIDGIWQIVPAVRLGDENFPVIASHVSALSDGIEVEGVAEVHGVRIRAHTLHRLHPTEPRLSMTTTFELEGDKSPGPIELGDEVKWGNTTYYVEGLGAPRLKYKGYAAWIGRRGAQGDLMLRPRSVERMWVDYAASAKFPGFLGAISAMYSKKGLKPGKIVTVSRELAFEPVPIPERPAPTDVGTLALRIHDKAGNPIPAKIRIDREGSDDPLFPADGGLDGADHFVWTGNGTAECTLREGRYRVLVTSGIERDAAAERVRIVSHETTRIEARLSRVIATPGVIGADLHLHQAPSVDADISLPARVIAIAAEGVELAVATDHYVVTDLAPSVRWLRDHGVLKGEIATWSGTEVSTVGKRFGHFNVFPLSKNRNVKYVDVTPSELFADARKQAPDGILQVNHPRLDAKLGYFTFFEMDPATGETRVPGYDPNYDSIEVYNGDDAYDVKRVRKVLRDFMRLVGNGRRYVATGSSDSHNLAFLDPGLPRTMIRYGSASSDAADVRAPAKAVLAALKSGHVTVTSGPIIDASIAGSGPGDTARGVGKIAHIHVTVDAAPWVDVRSLEVLEGGTMKQVKWLQIPKSQVPRRLDKIIDLPITGPTFFVVTAQGERGLPNASRPGTIPFAFTNPIWVEP